MCEDMEVMPELQWRPQDVGGARATGHLPRRAVGVGANCRQQAEKAKPFKSFDRGHGAKDLTFASVSILLPSIQYFLTMMPLFLL